MNQWLLAFLKLLMPTITWLLAAIIPGKTGRIMRQETCNKLDVMAHVTKNDAILPKTKPWPPLSELVKQSYKGGGFPALWALEGLGYHYANRAVLEDANLQGLLREASQPGLPATSLTMLHAGMGLSFAQIGFEEATLSSTVDMQMMVGRFIKRCQENSRQGYTGCAIESLGMVAHFEHGPAMITALDAVLNDRAPQYIPYLWHGAGRATYFAPMNFIPGFRSPMRAVAMCSQEASHETGHLNMLAGLGWAIMMVNMRSSEVIQSFLAMYAADHATFPGISNGITSAIVIREDTTPGFSMCLVDAAPVSNDDDPEDVWQKYVHRACQQAVESLQPALSAHKLLEQVFCYQNFEQLVAPYP